MENVSMKTVKRLIIFYIIVSVLNSFWFYRLGYSDKEPSQQQCIEVLAKISDESGYMLIRQDSFVLILLQNDHIEAKGLYDAAFKLLKK